MKNLRILPAIAGLALLAGGNALAQGPPPGGAGDEPSMHGAMGHGRGGMRQMRARHADVWRTLDLTDEQKKKIGDIRDRQMRKSIAARADLQIAALDLHKLIRADKPDQRAIDTQIDKIAGMRASLRKAQVASMLEMRGVLTDDQRKKLQDARPMHGRMGDAIGPGDEDHEGPLGLGEPESDEGR